MEEEYVPEIVSVIDEDGKEHVFEELDRIETDKGFYVALCPLPENPDEVTDEENDEFIVLRVIPGEGEESTLEPIEDPKEYDEIGHIFLDRLAEMFSDEEEEEN
ncbi:MAG: DUF1292 domain-containing protein [Clostridia bacterium]|jgi:uncharacterized protein YrzB (UPF0473 family)|nr:DUF1292 domain-containing protein [Clostridia bacterium]